MSAAGPRDALAPFGAAEPDERQFGRGQVIESVKRRFHG
jgi:hypothetical protein